MTRNPVRRALAAVAAVAASALALTACAGGSDIAVSAGTADDPIRIGVVSSGEAYWDTFSDLAEADGIHVEIVNFSDYQLPNQGLVDGDLDLNQFQHLQFLADFNVNTDNDLTPIGATAVYPLSLYSTKHTSVDQIPAGGEIAIPNDATNQARALLVLQDAGLITLTDGGNSFSTPADIDAANSKVTVTAVAAAQTPAALQDIDGAIVNNDFVPQIPDAHRTPIFEVDADSAANNPYINIWVARAADAQNETFAKLLEIFHRPEVTQGVLDASGGTGVIKDTPAAELQKILLDIEANQKAQKN